MNNLTEEQYAAVLTALSEKIVAHATERGMDDERWIDCMVHLYETRKAVVEARDASARTQPVADSGVDHAETVVRIYSDIVRDVRYGSNAEIDFAKRYGNEYRAAYSDYAAHKRLTNPER